MIFSSILFLRPWIIFTIIILNSFSGRLPISTSFSCYSGVLSWSFIWFIALCLFIFSVFMSMWFLFHRLQDCNSSCFCCLPSGGWGYLRGLSKFPDGRALCFLKHFKDVMSLPFALHYFFWEISCPVYCSLLYALLALSLSLSLFSFFLSFFTWLLSRCSLYISFLAVWPNWDLVWFLLYLSSLEIPFFLDLWVDVFKI